MSSDNSYLKSNIARGSRVFFVILHILVMKMSFGLALQLKVLHSAVICFSTVGSYMASSKLKFNNTVMLMG